MTGKDNIWMGVVGPNGKSTVPWECDEKRRKQVSRIVFDGHLISKGSK